MDESGAHNGSLAFILAGFVAEDKDWPAFTRDYQRLLKKWGIECFHATDFFNGAPPNFDHFNNSQKRIFIQSLIAILAKHRIDGISQGIDLLAFNEIITGALLKKIESHCILCFQMMMAKFNRLAGEANMKQDEKIAFIFDQQQQFSGRALQIHAKLKADPRFGTYLGSIGFESKQQFLPLQAADFLAYETYRELSRKLDRPEKDVRKSLIKLFGKVHLDGGYCDRAALTVLAESEMANEAQA